MILRRLFAFLIDKIIVGMLLDYSICKRHYNRNCFIFYHFRSLLLLLRIFKNTSVYWEEIIVVHQDGTTLKGSEAFIRFIAFYVINLTGILFVISIIMMIMREDNKMLHDLVFDTQVVKS